MASPPEDERLPVTAITGTHRGGPAGWPRSGVLALPVPLRRPPQWLGERLLRRKRQQS
jgi:hypothetical protein